jgi:2-oxo-4-hydroxy-4-carboxy--5-ureidoimidazoline (OHCU) decarboxylase
MTTWWLGLIIGSLTAVFVAFISVILALNRLQNGGKGGNKSIGQLDKSYTDIAEEEATHLFNKDFREELRNRGRLRFEKIIDENAMFLKQDLDMTISQLNEYMKQEIARKLDSEFEAYAKAMKDAQELALATLQRTAQEVEAQRVALADALKKDVAEREEALVRVYEENMAKVVEHYVLQALGEQFNLRDQLPYIIAQMEANKQNIIEDMRL